jgi:hypothetical protein
MKSSASPPPRLLDALIQRLRYMHCSLRTEQAYVYWVRSFVRWSGMRRPRDMGEREAQAFVSMLSNERRVSVSTHRQTLSAVLFLYKEVLAVDLPWMAELGHPAASRRIPVVLTRDEVQALFARHVIVVRDGNATSPLDGLVADAARSLLHEVQPPALPPPAAREPEAVYALARPEREQCALAA